MKGQVNKLKFFLERLLLRGVWFHILIMASLIAGISLIAGLLAYSFTSGFEDPGKSVWWAFLRLSDPGYLGDDEGPILRTLSTVVTVLGYVVFMGALIAVMTQWLHRTMRKLESGLTSISQRDHILILGWTNRTSTIIREILLSEGRVRRFLKRIRAKKLNIVVLAEDVSAELAHELQMELGNLWNHRQITLRSGTSLRVEHLQRVDFLNASVIIIPGTDLFSDGSEVVDIKAIKTLLTISNNAHDKQISDPPLVVAEIFDARKIAVAKAAYPGRHEIVAGDMVISRLIAQNVRHQGLSFIYAELLTHNEGNELYVRDCPQFEGMTFIDITGAFKESILLGVLRTNNGKTVPILNPPHDFKIQKDDRMVVLSRSYMNSQPVNEFESVSTVTKKFIKIQNNYLKRRLLILGWNHKIPSLIHEFDSYENESFDIDILSLVEPEKREEALSRYDLNFKHVVLQQLHGDYTAVSDLNDINPAEYDNILFVANDWMDSNEESDARSIMGSLILRDLLPKTGKRPEIILELMDPGNEKLFQKDMGEVIVSPHILSHILAHVGLRRELNIVFEELFTVNGAEIYFRKPADFELDKGTMRFKDIQKAVAQYGEICLGIQTEPEKEKSNGSILLNPHPDAKFNLLNLNGIVVLTTYS